MSKYSLLFSTNLPTMLPTQQPTTIDNIQTRLFYIKSLYYCHDPETGTHHSSPPHLVISQVRAAPHHAHVTLASTFPTCPPPVFPPLCISNKPHRRRRKGNGGRAGGHSTMARPSIFNCTYLTYYSSYLCV